MDTGDVSILWATSRSAPVSTHANDDGCALLIGDAIPRGASTRVSAESVHNTWTGRQSHSAIYDGFHAAAAVRHGEIAIGGDILGLFPIYYAVRGDVLLAGSSSAAFSAHPLFDDALDVHAMFGHLLASGPFDGRTLRRGVTRLSATALLRWSAQGCTREESRYELPVGRGFGSASFEAEVERFDAALDAAVRRHAGVHQDITVMLSGGRDSRLLSGYLARQGRSAHAVTFGAATDHDARCAEAVARALGFLHRRHEIPFGEFPEYADRNVHWEKLAGGMSTVHTWGSMDALRERGGGVLSGYLYEVRQIAPLPATREGMLSWTYAHAIPPDALRALANASQRSLVDEVVDAITQRFDALSVAVDEEGDDAERSWRWFMAVYVRFHAGAVPWRLSFASWPILPVLDQALIETMLTMRPSFLANRRLQDALLIQRLPALAKLPLDRNSDDVSPLVPTIRGRIGAAMRDVTLRDTSVERRYYPRMYDFDNEGWRAIRRAAEPGRDAMLQWFDRAALDAMLPSPERAAAHPDPIAGGFGPKLLAGIMRACATGEFSS